MCLLQQRNLACAAGFESFTVWCVTDGSLCDCGPNCLQVINKLLVAGAAAGAAAMPPPVPACSGEHAGELISSSELISNTCLQSTLPTRAHQIQQSGQKVLQWGHSSRLACYPGATRMAEFIRHRFWWPTLDSDTREFVAASDICSCIKASHRPPAGLLWPLPIPGRPWSDIALDFVTGLPTFRGNNTIMTVVDRFSKMVHFVALPKLPSTAEMADLLVSHVVRLHGIPQNIVSDRGPQFTSGVWRAFCRGIGDTVSLSSGYHPQTNGQAELANQALEATLRCVTTSNPASWSLHLPWVEYSLNTMVSAATGLSPFLCSLGYQPPLFPSQETEAVVPSVRAHLRRCRRVWKAAPDAMATNRDRVERTANRRRVLAPAYRPGQRVWLLARDLPLPFISRKLAPRFVGPYTIAQVINPSALRLTLPPSLKVHPVFHVSQVQPVAISGLSLPAPAHPRGGATWSGRSTGSWLSATVVGGSTTWWTG